MKENELVMDISTLAACCMDEIHSFRRIWIMGANTFEAMKAPLEPPRGCD
jgi:hypothetical protein